MVYFTPPDKNDSFTRIILDGDEYLFRFSYNYEGEFWTLGIYLRQYIKLPKGVLGVMTQLDKIGRNDFIDGNAQFVYVTYDEFNEYVRSNE